MAKTAISASRPKAGRNSASKLDESLGKLKEWLNSKGATGIVADLSEKPGQGAKPYPFVLATLPMRILAFQNHAFNPRVPNAGKVNELKASVSQLGLLSPLTCAYVGDRPVQRSAQASVEPVVLLDGRHRFNALVELKREDPAWANRAKIDLKIYYGLEPSDLFLLATYLNRTRKALARGEYYKVLVKVFEERKRELEEADGRPHTEKEIFRDVKSPSIANLNFDLSVGRIVGMTAFDPEEAGAWFPMVGTRQQERFEPPNRGLRPLTAGNMAAFLGPLCRTTPYDDYGEIRAVEVSNVLQLGELFRKKILKPVKDYEIATGTTVSCKHWCLVSFGAILGKSKLFHDRVSKRDSPLSDPEQDWETLERSIDAYYEVMVHQAAETNEWRDGESTLPPWSYQTQQDQVEPRLLSELRGRVSLLDNA